MMSNAQRLASVVVDRRPASRPKAMDCRRVIQRHRQGMTLAREETAMDDPRTIKVLGFAGSLRKGSYNRMALRAAEELLPDGMTLAIFDITPIPLFARIQLFDARRAQERH